MASQASPEYDYIVCGGGQAGCVVAARLAEDPAASILVLEAGGSKDSVPASDIPAAVAQILGTDADWNIYNTPCKALNDRELHLGRGKFVGGTSGTNGTLCIRGPPEDYDAWNVPSWSGREMHKYMNKAESFRNKRWFKAEESAHGHDGPLITAPHDNAPISDRVLESFQSAGLPLVPDMFTTGDVPHGCGYAIRSIYKGIRTTAADYVQGSNKKDNVQIETHCYVDSIVLESAATGGLRATGVKVLNVVGRERLSTIYNARKEIILSAGAYGSPAVLLRSGIGDSEELSKHEIRLRHELKGVGKNLQDHMVLLNFYEVNKPDITNDHLVWHTGGREKSLAQWKTDRTGFMSQFPFGSFAYARLDERLKDSKLWQQASEDAKGGLDAMGNKPSQPHVEFWNTECYSPKYLYRDFPTDNKYAFAMAVELFSQQSRGTVGLAGTDPTANLLVDHNYLSDPLDMLVFSEACVLANEIAVQGAGTKNLIKGSWPDTNGYHSYTERKQWEKEIRQRADTCYHPAGTCKMGDQADPLAVVDSQLRIHGVANLRVVDASIMPKLPSGHPQMAVYGIAEKAADMIKQRMK